jgi:uncharacterized membrane protein
MLRKTQADERGRLTEASVVQSPRARLFGGVSNALIGVCYYPALAIGIWLLPWPASLVLLAASAAAAITSLRLAYSLLFETRMPCPYCWTSHVVNWALLGMLGLILASRA